MFLIPKNRKYVYKFRSKIRKSRVKVYDQHQFNPFKKTIVKAFENKRTSLTTLAWIPIIANSTAKERAIDPKSESDQEDKKSFKIMFKTHKKLSLNYIKTTKLSITKMLKRDLSHKKSKIVLPLHCNQPITARGTGVRMGKGKGNVVDWEASVRPYQTFFELYDIKKSKAIEILLFLEKRGAYRLKLVAL